MTGRNKNISIICKKNGMREFFTMQDQSLI